MPSLTIRRVPIASLHLDPANARQHPEKNLAGIKGSLATFGQAEPLVVPYTLTFVNSGDDPLHLVKAWANCGCVKVTDATKNVAIGDVGRISIMMNTQDQPQGFIEKRIHALYSPNSTSLSGVIRATIAPYSHVYPPLIEIDAPPGDTLCSGSGVVRVPKTDKPTMVTCTAQIEDATLLIDTPVPNGEFVDFPFLVSLTVAADQNNLVMAVPFSVVGESVAGEPTDLRVIVHVKRKVGVEISPQSVSVDLSDPNGIIELFIMDADSVDFR